MRMDAGRYYLFLLLYSNITTHNMKTLNLFVSSFAVESSISRFRFFQYSQKLKKVFIDIDKVLALQFKLSYDEVKPNTEFFVRAMPVYTQDDALREPVKRCPIHSMPEYPSNHGNLCIRIFITCRRLHINFILIIMIGRFPLCRTRASVRTRKHEI